MKARTAAAVAGPRLDGTPIAAESPTSTGLRPTITRKRSLYRAEKRLAEQNLVEVAAATGRFNSFGAAIRLAGLVNTLSENGPFTIFAPTDEAFAKMPKADLDALLEDKPRLTRVLTYHVVPEIVAAPREGSPSSATSVNGAALTITAKNRGFKMRFRVNDALVVKTEITALNGVIHAIDTVLMPR